MNENRSFRFLARWSVVTAVVPLLLAIAFFGGLGVSSSDTALGSEYVELFQAVRSPEMYRLAMTFDALSWMAIGVSLLAMAFALRHHAPLMSLLIASSGIGQLSGMLGGFLRLNGISELAARYASAGIGEQAAVLQAYLDHYMIINGLFHAGNLVQGLGFLLAALAFFSLNGFPRWLAVWLFIPGLLPVIQFVLVAAGSPFVFPLLMTHIFVGIVGVHAALALVLRRPSRMPVSTVAA